MRQLLKRSCLLMASVALAVCFLITSCNNNTTAETGKKDSAAAPKELMSPELRFTADAVDNKKDPACGMPVTAGISDTAHYHNKVLGFCSKECKAEFEKTPEKYIAAAEMK